MGRPPLLAILAAAVAACTRPATPPAGMDAHATLACAKCHQGSTSDRPLASVPPEACTASGCHDRGVASVTMLASVPFDHRRHAEEGGVAAGCAGCHVHEDGNDPLVAGPGTCGLCHADELTGDRPEGCRVCHAAPSHVGMTSQGVAVPHEGLPWIEGGCLRCHYQVATPVQHVDLARCTTCHADVAAAASSGVGEDLHPAHVGSACVACHAEDEHRIEAMSSAVDLVCTHCHAQAHGVELASSGVASRTCDGCHRESHRDPQRLLLGIVPLGTAAAAPSDHFMDGLTCRSCHADEPSDPAVGRGASGRACATCHRSEYATILTWWQEGVRERVALVERYLAEPDAATATLDPASPARTAVLHARELVELIRRGGGSHNLSLTHRMLEEALRSASEAERLAGRVPPATPSLGRAPRQGLCSYCHYRLDEPGLSDRMDDAFHRAVMGGR